MEDLTLVVVWYEIYETSCVISVFASKIPKLHNEFHNFHINWPRMQDSVYHMTPPTIKNITNNTG